ncbi:MAG: amino acid-binding protein [Marmoricola sp.]
MRHTLAKLAAVLPAEFALHALVLRYHFSYLVTVLALVLATTILVICVVEPSTMRLLSTWLHAPHEKREQHVDASLALWRMRVTVEDEPGSLERITRALAQCEANILSLKVHPLEEGVLDEIVVATHHDVHPNHLTDSLASAGGRDIDVEATSPLALVDIETRALDLAGRVAGNPAELPQAVATLLDAVLVTESERIHTNSAPPTDAAMTTLRIQSSWTTLLLFDRPGRPFTPAESARAHRLAAIAEEHSPRAENQSQEQP